MHTLDQFEYSAREFRAVKFYEGGKLLNEHDEFFNQRSAYRTLNLLMMAGSEGENARICIEKQKPKSIFIRRWEQTAEVLLDIFAVSCRYAIHRARQGKSLPSPLIRGDRGVNFQLMKAVGGTYAFTSTTEGEMQDFFIAGKQNPHVLHIALGENIPYLDFTDFLGGSYHFKEQREILLPPMLKMECSECIVQTHEGFGPVPHYSILLTHFDTDITILPEQELTSILEVNCNEAALGLEDLVLNGFDSHVILNNAHPYWTWKNAFRQLISQRMKLLYDAHYQI